MKKKLLSILSLFLVSSMLFSNTLNANAAPVIMADGSIFDAEYYAQANPDVVGVLGNDAAVLYNHYVSNGKAEGRAPHDPSLNVSTLTASAAYAATINATLRPTDSNYLQLKTALPGTYITFGTYEQDNNLKNGQEPIEWLVLENDGESLFVLSKYVLDNEVYSTYYVEHTWKPLPVTWETSNARNWLNSTFLATAFTAGEQNLIKTTLVNNQHKKEYSTKVIGGNDTLDKIFYLSVNEIDTYLPRNEFYLRVNGEPNYYNSLLRAKATPYAIARNAGVWTKKDADREVRGNGDFYAPVAYDIIDNAWWALRTPADDEYTWIRYVGPVGSWPGVRIATYDDIGNRPAMRITIQ